MSHVPFSVLSIPSHEFLGFGVLLMAAVGGLLVTVALYKAFWVGLLIFNLKEYQYEMNAFSPVDSEIIRNISDMLAKGMYILAAYAAIATLVGTSGLTIFSLPTLLLVWSIIATQFLLTQSTLGTIVNKAKWKTLNKLQAQINSIEATEDLSDKEAAERLLRLAGIHTQIMASKTNTFDWNSLSTLLSQLMLPLLGLLLGNLDKIWKLLP